MISETLPREPVNGMAHDKDHTVYQLVDKNKVIFDRLLVNFSEVRFGDRDKTVAVLEYEGGVGIGPDRMLRSICALKNCQAYLVTATT